MPLGNWNLEWLNHNSNRAYPLSETATKRDLSGRFAIPNSFLVGLYLPVHAGLAVEPQNFYLRSVSVFATGYSIVIAYDDGSPDPPIVATASIARATHVEYTPYLLPGLGDFADTTGKVVLGDIAEMDLQPAGQFFFSPAGGRLDPDCVRPQIRGVTSISVVNGPDRSPRLYGDIELVAGANIQITPIQIGDSSQIRFDAIEGAGLTENCECEGDDGPPIRTINGIPPDGQGNFTLVGSVCLDIAGIAHGLRLTDVCSEPCCGPAELEALTLELEHLGVEAATLRGIIVRLQGSVDQTAQVILGSRLNDSPCVTCV